MTLRSEDAIASIVIDWVILIEEKVEVLGEVHDVSILAE